MKRSYRIAGKVIVAGLIGIGIFIASLFATSFLVPPSDHPDVVEGWAVAMFMIIGMFLSILLSGVIGVLLSFNEIKTLKEAIVVSFFSGVVTTIIPMLIGVSLGFSTYGGYTRPALFELCLIVLFACDMLATIGGLLTFLLLSFLRKRKMKRQGPGPL